MGRYRRVATPNGIQYEHRVVMEEVLGRRLERHEIVHHINHDPRDNRPENLMVTTQSEHIREHMDERPDLYNKGGKRTYKFARRSCAWCGAEFQPRVNTNLCCSVSCAQRRRYSHEPP